MEATPPSISNNYIPPSQQYPSRPLVTGSIGIGLGIVASAIFASSIGLRIPVITRTIAPISASFSNPIGRTATLIFAIASLAIGLGNVFKGCLTTSNREYSNALETFARKCLVKTKDQDAKQQIRALAQFQPQPSSWREVETLQTKMLQLMNLAPQLNTDFPLRTESSIQITDYPDTNCTVYKTDHGSVEEQISVGFSDMSDHEITLQWGEVQNSGQNLILNAANYHLQGGGGIDGAINKKGGPIYVQNQRAVTNFTFNQNEPNCYSEGYKAGHAVCIDSGPEFKLNGTQGVILVAAPNLNKMGPTDPTQQVKTGIQAPTDQQRNELYSCYLNSLILADHFFKENPELDPTLGLVCLGSGVFGWEQKTTRDIMKQALYNFYQKNSESKLKVTVYLYYDKNKITENDRTEFVNKFTEDWDVEGR